MIISPDEPRDFLEMLQSYSQKQDVELSNLESIYSNNDAIKYIINSMHELHIEEYEQLCTILDDKEKNILFFYKLIIYDFYDFLIAFQNFCGIQKYSVARSLCEHSRMFLLCLCDIDFRKYYFKGFVNDNDKKTRYYKKKGNCVSKKLRGIAEAAKELNSKENTFYAESYIFNITTDMYTQLSDSMGQLTHLSEIMLAEKMISENISLNFENKKTKEMMKFDDLLIEYLIYTTLSIFIIFRSEEIQTTLNMNKVFNLLNDVGYKLFQFRNTDLLLTGLKQNIQEILSEDTV